MPSPPTLLKQLSISAPLARWLSLVSHGFHWYHMAFQVPPFRLSYFLLCSFVTSCWHSERAQPWSSSILSCWSKRLLGCFPGSAALGQLAKTQCATGSGKPAQPSPSTRAGGCRACPRLTPSNGVWWLRVVSPSCLQAEVCL